MGKEQKAEIMGCQVDLLSLNQALEEIKKLLGNQKTFAHIITVNAEIIYEANKNPRLKEIINGAHMVTPDGIGVVWAARQFGYTSSGRVTGIELLEEVCSEGARRGWRVFFFGAAPGVAEKAASNLENKYPGLQVAGTINGYFAPEETADIVTTIKKSNPDILFVGLGAPRQEYWINEYKDQLQVVCVGVGGSFDVIAGLKKRAPAFMIKLNLEWLYRLISEPSRIKRQLALPKFVLHVLKEKYRRH
ncbi:MAG: WecB/TagA/CpsF family glycosyltransferase [Syntrophomonadaceae bacterium]|jgi:N-acetylglucosaminyldiphosphoundecaprenol N-acetyl-beta-D-mannosaminyltransferase|nr:WecB/TagA/CpsF family glycosyltransferase [Syntrophomonadaceae bacterium]